MTIPDLDSLFRHCIFPIPFKNKIFSPEKLIRLQDQEDGSFLASLAWRKFIPTVADIHAYGCRLAAHMNESDLAKGKYKEGRQKSTQALIN